MISPFRTMSLYGYEVLGDERTGFCTGLYTAVGKTNELFVPVPTVEGDESSHVMGFVSVEPEGEHKRYTGDEITLSVGDEWKDLLLVDGYVHFGTRTELIEEFEPWLKKLFRHHPFTALDLVRGHDRGGARRTALRMAYDRISDRLGKSNAERWSVETYYRSQVLKILRRKMQKSNASAAAIEAVRHIQVAVFPKRKTISFVVPVEGEWNPDDMQPFLRLEEDSYAHELLREIPSVARNFKLEARFETGSLKSHYRPKPVLVTALGRGAERFLRDLQLDGGRARLASDANWPSRLFEFAKVKELVRHPESMPLKNFSFLAVIVDEDGKSDRLRSQMYEIQDALKDSGGIPLLVVPVLPRQRPSKYLRSVQQVPIFDESNNCLTLDTSFLRSPGHPRFKVASQSAAFLDYFTKACLLLLNSPDTLSRFVSASSRGRVQRCLRVAEVIDPIFGPRLAPSEAVSVRTVRSDLGERSFLWNAGEARVKHESHGATLFELSLEDIRQDGFADLAEAALRQAISRTGIGAVEFRLEGNAQRLPIEMQFPDMTAAAIVSFPDGSKRSILITAESPTLNAVKSAERYDMYVVRYTDRPTLKRLLAAPDEYFARRPLPQDLAALRVYQGRNTDNVFRRAGQAEGLFVTVFDWQRWEQEFSGHRLARRGMHVVPNGTRNVGGDNRLVFVSDHDVQGFGLNNPGDVGLKALLEFQIRATAPGRVVDDSELSFPGQNVYRWAVRTNRRLFIPRRLPETLTVPEGWVVFNGDRYAAAVIVSDIFEIWMKGHAATSDLPGPAFTQLRAFNAFPWPAGFILDGTVTCSAPPSYFSELAKELPLSELDLDYREPSATQLRQEIAAGFRYELGQSLLATYGLEGNCSEAEILSRLIFLSENGDARSEMRLAT